MDILKFPSDISLSGNMQKCIISTSYDISFVLTDNTTGEVVIEHSYSPSADHLIEVDLKPIIQPLLSFHLQNVTTIYKQPDIMHSFTVEIAEVVDGVKQDPTSRSFKVFRTGVDELADSPLNFLKSNFLTWQPNVKGVTYYSPEFLTYYASEPVTVKCTAYVAPSAPVLATLGASLDPIDITLATLSAGSVYTIPVSYSVIASKLDGQYPSYYDILVENESGNRLTYIQRYYAEDMKSPDEQWILFENSLGGIDTFRAYGNSENTAEHTHNVVEIDDNSQEYRVDTERSYNKNTGYLDKKERVWLLDFFPSLGKYIYVGNHLRRIVVTESDASYTDKELPSFYTFKYKYADARPYLNIPRTDTPQEVLNISVPDLGSFTIAPRLVEFPRLSLSGGALLPVQDPYSEDWNATTIDGIFDYIFSHLQASGAGGGGVGHTHDNMSLLMALAIIDNYLCVNGKKISSGYADKAGSLDEKSEIWKKFIRKDINDVAQGLITFLKGLVAEGVITANGGIDFGQFVTGLFGMGGRIDAQGCGELRSLRLWEWLEVPEIRFNKITVNIGLSIRSEGGGIIERAVPDVDSEGNQLATGSAYLKLEDGEYGAIDVNDLCMGMWHDFGGGNATENSDDKKGTIQMRGFKTIYFWITDIPDTDPDGKDNSDQHFFRYQVRSSSNGGNGIHPVDMLHFAQRGNTSNTERQHIVFSTTRYTIKLHNLSTWDFSPSTIYDIDGVLDGFSMEQVGLDGQTYVKQFQGTGHVVGNAYIYGEIEKFERVGYRLIIEQSFNGTIAPNETETETCRILNGYGEDVTSKFIRFSVSRDSGDASSDLLWNAQHNNIAIEESPFTFEIAFADLGIRNATQISTMFTVTAYDEAQDAIAEQSLIFN